MNNERQHQEDLQRIRGFRLIDDDFMNVCFDDNISGTELLLRIILNKPDIKVKNVKTQKVMKKTGLSIGDFDLIEANEAFAAQSVAVQHDLGFSSDILNVNGGAIALGHPVGCSGNRILVSLLYEMQRRDVHRGLATLCVGGGMGCAAIVER